MTEIKSTFSVGDYIIDFENIYKITGQKDQNDFSGKMQSYFFYEPIDVSKNNTTFSIPVKNISRNGLRTLIDQNVVKKIFEKSEEKIDQDTVLDFKAIKEKLYENNPEKSLVILKQLFLERVRTAEKFSRVNKEILDSILNHISDEIAFVSKKEIPEIQKKLTVLIEKSLK